MQCIDQILGDGSNYHSGLSVSNAGDVNGDGFGDIIIGSPSTKPYGRINAGISYIIFGHSSSQPYTDIDLASPTFTSSGVGFKVFCCLHGVAIIADTHHPHYLRSSGASSTTTLAMLSALLAT